MADFVEIISKQEIQNVKDADKALNSLLNTLNVTVATANKLNLSGGAASRPSQYNANTAQSNKAVLKAIFDENKARQALEAQRQRSIAAMDRENAKLQAAQTLQFKTAAQIKVLDAAYTQLALKKERYNNLTANEEKRLNTLTLTLQKYRQIQDGVNSTVGKFQQRVGNYAGAFNPLNNSIDQLVREIPSAAGGLRIFFSAIGNNAPIAYDAIKNVIQANKELAAQGKETTSVLKQLGTAFFSFGTALSIGLTVLTLFGEEIQDAIFGTKAKAEADKKASEATEAKTRAEVEYNSIINKSTSEEISRSKILFENAKNVNIQMSDRLSYIAELRERYPDYLNNLSDEQILAGNTADAELRLNDALLKRGIALALQDKIGKAYSKLTDEILKQQELQRKALTIDETINKSNLTNKNTQIANAKILNNAQVIASRQQQDNIKKEIQELLNLYNTYSPYLDVVQESATANSKASEEAIQAETNSREAFERTISSLENKLSLMSQENAAYGVLSGQLKIVKGAYEALYGVQEDSNTETEKTIKYGTAEYYQDVINKLSKERDSLADTTEEYELYNQMIARSQEQLDKLTNKTKDIERLNDEVQKYLGTFREGFLSNAKLDSFNLFLTIDEKGKSPFDKLLEQADTAQERFAVTFNAIAESAQEAFAFMNQNSQAYFDTQYANLDREKSIALQFAGESEAGKAEIQRQYEDRRREIQRREAQANKEQAIFNIALNTAQGITAALATVPPNVPLSIIIGAVGAAQAAAVASRQIPAYKMGTSNHKGGFAIVGDGNKHEVVHQPTLGWSITPDKSTLVDLEKGSKVFPDLASSGILNSNLPDMVQLNGGGLTEAQMDRIMKRHAAKNVPQINIDKNGLRVYVRTETSRVEKMNNNVRFKN